MCNNVDNKRFGTNKTMTFSVSVEECTVIRILLMQIFSITICLITKATNKFLLKHFPIICAIILYKIHQYTTIHLRL